MCENSKCGVFVLDSNRYSSAQVNLDNYQACIIFCDIFYLLFMSNQRFPLQRDNFYLYEPFGLGRFATRTHSKRRLAVFVRSYLAAARPCLYHDYNTRRLALRYFICYMYGFKLYSIGKSVSFDWHSIILNKHIVIDLRLLFMQRNTQASNNRNTM